MAKGTQPESQARRVHLVVVALLVLGFAGCTNDRPSEESSNSEGPSVTDPKSFLDEANASAPHVHDYWGGLDTIELLNETIQQPWTERFEWAPPPGATVIPGTARVAILVDWPASPTRGKMSMAYWTAAAPHPRETPGLDNGVPWIVNTTTQDTDPPHTSVSRWSFEFTGTWHPQAVVEPPVDISFRIQIHRVDGMLPLWPGHRQVWGANQSLTLYAEEGRLEDRAVPGVCTCPNWNPVPDPVPIGTERMDVQLYLNSSGPGALNYMPVLSWNAADSRTRNHVRESPAVVPGGFVWRLDVNARMWDSPYVNETYWSFYLERRDGNDGPHPTYMDGDFHLRFIAYRGPG